MTIDIYTHNTSIEFLITLSLLSVVVKISISMGGQVIWEFENNISCE
jgi:hypothetical protein